MCHWHYRDGVIDKTELKALLHSTDGGLERVTKHPVRVKKFSLTEGVLQGQCLL